MKTYTLKHIDKDYKPSGKLLYNDVIQKQAINRDLKYTPPYDSGHLPLYIIDKMLDYQVKQGNKLDISVFENEPSSNKADGGFDWKDTEEGWEYWEDLLSKSRRWRWGFYKMAEDNDVIIVEDTCVNAKDLDFKDITLKNNCTNFIDDVKEVNYTSSTEAIKNEFSNLIKDCENIVYDIKGNDVAITLKNIKNIQSRERFGELIKIAAIDLFKKNNIELTLNSIIEFLKKELNLIKVNIETIGFNYYVFKSNETEFLKVNLDKDLHNQPAMFYEYFYKTFNKK